MSKVKVGQKIPDFELPATGDTIFKLSDFRGSRVVLYFYPRDSTPGCTLEGRDFSSKKATFARNNTEIFGISRDSLKAHDKFKTNQKFRFELLSDADEKVCRIFDVIKQKTLFGKKVRGIQRSTFIVDEKGVLRQEWRKVKVFGHAGEVLKAIKSL